MEYDYTNRLQIVKRDDGTPLQAFQYSPSGSRSQSYDYLTDEFIDYANLGGTTLAEYREITQGTLTWTKSYTYLGDGLLSTMAMRAALNILSLIILIGLTQLGEANNADSPNML